MVLTKEYRIPMPISLEEYRIAQRYSVAKISKQQTGHGEGIEVVTSEPYEDEEHGTGTFTHKIFRIGSKIPGWIKAVIPPSALQIEEKAWNAYPYCKTVYSVPFLGDRFGIAIETRYLADKGDTENALKLNDDTLKKRVVDTVDIAFDPIDPTKYKEEEDPTIFTSEKTGRGKLTADWRDTADPIMCSYKYCSVEFRYFGLQTSVENYVHKVALRDVFVLGHRQAFCWIDDWIGLTMEDILRIEEETKVELDTLLHEDPLSEGDGAGGSGSPKGSPKGTPSTDRRSSVDLLKKANRNSGAESPKGSPKPGKK